MVKWPKPDSYFAKLAYDPSNYDPDKADKKESKKGFGSSKPPGREDLSSTREVGQYRHALEQEKRHDHIKPEDVRAMTQNRSGTLGSTAQREGGMQTLRFESQFDRQQYVPTFTVGADRATKWNRNYGPLRPMSLDMGEGCYSSELKAPEAGKRDFEAAFRTGAHSLITGTQVPISQ